MRTRSRETQLITLALLAGALALATGARADSDTTTTGASVYSPAYTDISPDLIERNLSGPRLGFTYRADAAGVNEKNVGRFVSQFGWHFERQVVPDGGGPQFIMQFVPLVAAVEYGKFAPSGSFGLGVRFPSGYEFGIGPTVSLGRANEYGGAKIRSAMFVAVGRSFDYGGVSIPVNLALATNRDGQRLSVIVGYALQRAQRALPHTR